MQRLSSGQGYFAVRDCRMRVDVEDGGERILGIRRI